MFELNFDLFALSLKELKFRVQSKSLLLMFLLKFGQFGDISLSSFDFRFEEFVAVEDFAELVVLIVKVISEDSDKFAEGQIIETLDERVSDFGVKKPSLGVHEIKVLY